MVNSRHRCFARCVFGCIWCSLLRTGDSNKAALSKSSARRDSLLLHPSITAAAAAVAPPSRLACGPASRSSPAAAAAARSPGTPPRCRAPAAAAATGGSSDCLESGFAVWQHMDRDTTHTLPSAAVMGGVQAILGACVCSDAERLHAPPWPSLPPWPPALPPSSARLMVCAAGAAPTLGGRSATLVLAECHMPSPARTDCGVACARKAWGASNDADPATKAMLCSCVKRRPPAMKASIAGWRMFGRVPNSAITAIVSFDVAVRRDVYTPCLTLCQLTLTKLCCTPSCQNKTKHSTKTYRFHCCSPTVRSAGRRTTKADHLRTEAHCSTLPAMATRAAKGHQLRGGKLSLFTTDTKQVGPMPCAAPALDNCLHALR